MEKKILLLLFAINSTIYSQTLEHTTINDYDITVKQEKSAVSNSVMMELNFKGKAPLDSVRSYYESAMLLAKENREELSNAGQEACLSFQLAEVYWHYQSYDMAISQLKNTLALSKKLNDNSQVVSCYELLSQIYIEKGDLLKGIEYNLEIIRSIEKETDTLDLVQSRNTLAVLYVKTEQYDKAIAILKNNLGSPFQWQNDKKTLFELYSNMGIAYALKKQYDLSLVYQKKSLDLLKDLNLNSSVAVIAHKNIGLTYTEIGNTIAAIKEYKLGIKLAEQEKDNLKLAGTLYLLIAGCNEKMENYHQMLYFARKYKGLNNSMSLELDIEYYRLLGIAYNNLGENDLGGNNFEEIKMLYDSVNLKNISPHVLKLEEKYLTEHKENEDTILMSVISNDQPSVEQTQTIKFFYFFGLFGLCFAVLYVFIAFNKNRNLPLEGTDEHLIVNKQHYEAASSLEIDGNLNHKIDEINASWERSFSIVAHDLRAPYNIILGYADVLVDNFDTLNRRDIKKYLITLHKSAHKNYQLTQNLLSWAMLKRGGLKVNKQELNVKEIIDESISVYMEMAEQKGIRLVNRCPATLSGNLDRDIVTSVLSNLVNNAIKFTSKEGTVTISAKNMNSRTIFKVDDSGIGMPKGIARNLYKLAKLNSRVGTANEPGTGLGLILCKELLHLHRGKIRIKSALGKGTSVLALF